MEPIDRINTKSSQRTILGWFVGLAYFNWFSATAAAIPWWQHVGLIVGGMLFASIVIGGGIALLIAGITRIITGRGDGSVHGFAWGAFISPLIAFFAAKYVLRLFEPSVP